jgi:hypothetical protein
MTIKKTSAVIEFVANSAKRVIVIMGVAIVMGESLNPSSSPAEPWALVVYTSTPSSKISLARKIRLSQRQHKLIGRKRACCGRLRNNMVHSRSREEDRNCALHLAVLSSFSNRTVIC